MCVHAYTHRHTLQAEKVASGLEWPPPLWWRQAFAVGPRKHLSPSCPALSPWAGSWLSMSGPSLFKGPLGHLGLPLSPSLEVLSTCLPALRRGWSPPLPSSPAPFPTQSYQAGADPASCCPVWGPHTSQSSGSRDPVFQAPWAMLLVHSLLPGHDPFGTASTPYPQGRLEPWSSCHSLWSTWPVPGTIIFHQASGETPSPGQAPGLCQAAPALSSVSIAGTPTVSRQGRTTPKEEPGMALLTQEKPF